jgi:hypothetical protein
MKNDIELITWIALNFLLMIWTIRSISLGVMGLEIKSIFNYCLFIILSNYHFCICHRFLFYYVQYM